MLLAAILLAGLLVSLFFDPNDYRDEIAGQVQAETGRQLQIDGDLELSIFPWLAVEVGPARLSQAPGFGEAPFLEIQGARAGIRLLPLLSGQVQVSQLNLDGLRLRLARDAAGRANWDDLAQDKGEDTPAGAAPEGAGLEQVEIGGIVINDAAVSFDDRQAGSRLELSAFNLSTGALKLGQPVDLAVAFALAMDDDQRMDVSMASRLEADPARSAVALRDTALSLKLSGPDLPGGAVDVDAQVRSLELTGEDLSVKGLVARVLGATLEAELTGSAMGSDQPRLAGRVVVPRLSLRDVLGRLEAAPATADANALSSFQMSADLAYDGQSLALDKLDAQLDQSRLQGRVSVAPLDKPVMGFDLAVDAIDLDRYLPPAAEAEAAGGDEQDLGEEFDLAGLRKLNAKGQLRAGKLGVAGLSFDDAQVTVSARGGLLKLSPLKTGFYGGLFEGTVEFDARGDEAKLVLNEKLADVQMAPVLKALADKTFLSGRMGGGLSLTATGNSVKALLASLAGDLNLALDDGALEGVDLTYELQRAQSLMAKQAPAQRAAGARRTPFRALKASARVDKGVVRSDNLSITTSVMTLAGEGGMNLLDQGLDYRLKALVLEQPEGEGAVDLGRLRGVTVPLRIGGTLTEPKVEVDLEGVLKEKAKEKLEDALKDKLKKKLFGN